MPIKVLVVDDSALMRKHLRGILEEGGDFIVTTARDGRDALVRVAEDDPDVITLDINMPVMDGLECLSHIMTDYPRPVIMVSSLTNEGAVATFEAMELGAVDYVLKPGGTVSLNIREVSKEICAKVRAAARSRRRTSTSRRSTKPAAVRPTTKKPATSLSSASVGLVLIGVSTGGPSTLETILTELPADFPCPILVSQHMPARFTGVFAQRLNNLCALNVKEVTGPTPLQVGEILIARGESDVIVGKRVGKLMALNMPPDSSLWHPSVDRMVHSALEHFDPKNLIGVELTGMGYDGAEAMAKLHAGGGRTIAESEDSAVVFGMPKELIERGGAEVILPADKIAAQLRSWLR